MPQSSRKRKSLPAVLEMQLPACYNDPIYDKGELIMADKKPVPGKDGNRYIPFDERTGESSVVFFTRDLSEEGLKKINDRVSSVLCGKVAIKLHTGEAEGPNIIPRPWVKELISSRLPEATIIETNTYYEGSRYTTEEHRKTLQINGWTFCPVDITDAEGVAALPVKGGKWFSEMHVGKSMLNYDSLLVLTHFKGHTMGRLRRQQQEHRHRLRRRANRQEGDPYASRRRHVEHRRGGADGAHLREHQGHDRPFRAARLLYQHDAQHVRLLRLA